MQTEDDSKTSRPWALDPLYFDPQKLPRTLMTPEERDKWRRWHEENPPRTQQSSPQPGGVELPGSTGLLQRLMRWLRRAPRDERGVIVSEEDRATTRKESLS